MYNYKEVEKLIERYSQIENSTILQTSESVLGCGNWILAAPNKKTAIIKEVFVNSWSSTHTITMYNKTPKKYLHLIN